MTAKFEEKVAALTPLAMGESAASAARYAGVSPATVKRWLGEDAFAEEVERLRPLATATPMDGRALIDALEAARGRLRGFTVNGPNSVTAHISIPSYATPAEARRIRRRAMARALAAVLPEQP